MRLVPILALLWFGWVIFSTYHYVCVVKGLCGNDTTQVVSSPTPKKETPPAPKKSPAENTSVKFPLKFTDGDKFNFGVNDNISFTKNNYRPSISGKVNQAFRKLVGYMNSNPSRALELTGIYSPNEKNIAGYDNLGVARAEMVKERLMTLGLNDARISTKGAINNNSIFKNDTLYGGILYGFNTFKGNTNDAANSYNVSEIERELRANPIVLYFPSGVSSLELDIETERKLRNLKVYLQRKNGKKSSVTGHTDSQGKTDSNRILGKRRALFIKEYLVSLGVNEEQVNVASEGESKPIADNNTQAGRAKNRRVVISLD